MLSKKQIKFIVNLSQKKHRDLSGYFVVEGLKSILDLVSSGLELEGCYSISKLDLLPEEVQTVISERELRAISNLTTPHHALGVFKMPLPKDIPSNGMFLALDGVRDPGNFGTIMRLCDWFGVKHLICSIDSVDCFNPKVVQATMGSIGRVCVHYVNLSEWLSKSILPKIGTFVEASSVYDFDWPTDAILVMGNEGQGISDEVRKQLTAELSIPKFNNQLTAESLNVATATSIILNEYFRPTIEK